MKIKMNNNGYSLIELITAMAIMALLGSALFTLVSSGGNSYQRIKKAYTSQNEARVAMSYILVKIRQNDRIYLDTSVSPVAVTAGVSAASDILRVRDPSYPPPSEKSWWIYRVGTNLMENYTDDPTTGTGSAIAVVKDFTVEQLPKSVPTDATRLKISIQYNDGNTVDKELEEVISLRSDSP